MTSITFKNNKYYPTISVTLGTDLVDDSTEIVIEDSGTEIHRDEATVLDAPEGVVAYDLDGAPELSPSMYDVQFEVFDSNDNSESLYPSTPVTLDVEPGTGGHIPDDSSVTDKPDVQFGRVDAEVVDVHTADAEVLNTGELTGVADWIVTDLDDLYEVFPADGEPSPLADGDTVLIDPESTLRPDRDLHVNPQGPGTNVSGISIHGTYAMGEDIDIMPADGSNAGSLILRSGMRGCQIEGLSFDGNAANQTDDTNGTPFIDVWSVSDVYIGYNYARDLHPQGVHQGDGDFVQSPGFSNPTNVYGYHNRCERPGDRMWTIVNATNVQLWGQRLSEGFDRMVTFSGVVHGSLRDSVSGGHSEGSVVGIQDTGSSGVSDIAIENVRCEGEQRGFANIYADSGNGLENVTIRDCKGVKTGGDLARPAIRCRDNGSDVTVENSYFEGYDDGGVRLAQDNTHIHNNTFVDISGSEVFFYADVTDANVTSANDWDNINAGVASDGPNAVRPRWDGMIYGGPLGGVDIGTVTGQFDGDEARTNGGSASVANVRAVWDANNSQWKYPSSFSTV